MMAKTLILVHVAVLNFHAKPWSNFMIQVSSSCYDGQNSCSCCCDDSYTHPNISKVYSNNFPAEQVDLLWDHQSAGATS
jgi:hypothetical protein